MARWPAYMVLFVLICASGRAYAQTRDELAQEYFDEGAAHYVSGDYARAIVEFRKAFTQVENPIFLYNVAASQRNMGRCSEAAATARQTLGMQGVDDSTAGRAEGIVIGCQIAATARAVEPATSVVAGSPDVAQESSGERIDTAESSGFGTMGWTGVALATAGGISVVGGTILGLQLETTYDEYATTTDPLVQQDRRDELEANRPVAYALLFGGGALAATGLVLILLDLGDDETTLSFVPDATAPRLQVEGRF